MTDHPIFAAMYDWTTGPAERGALGRWRRRLLAHATGRVLEVGGGTGQNLRHYPAGKVQSVVVCEPDGAMRRRLVQRLAGAAVEVTVHPGGVPGLPFPDASFDTVVCTLVLCTVEDVEGTLAEVRRLLRTDGRLLFLEHVRGVGVTRAVQRAVDPLWGHLSGGCHLDRDTVWDIRHAGFAVTDCERPSPLGRWSSGVFVVGGAMVHQEVA